MIAVGADHGGAARSRSPVRSRPKLRARTPIVVVPEDAPATLGDVPAAHARRAAGAASPTGCGRPIHVGLSVFVWAMIGIAFWHFSVFVPDRFWGGIIGAFLAALAGALLSGFLRCQRQLMQKWA